MANKLKLMSAGMLLLVGLLAACGATPESMMSQYAAPAMDVEEAYVEAKGAQGTAPGEAANDTDPDSVQADRMIIWNADISLVVEDTQAAVDEVQALARRLGGYATYLNSWLAGEELHAQITIRIPAEQFEPAMSQLRELAIEVTQENAFSEDVTDEYVDLESRLRHLEAKEAQLLTFLDQAEDTEAVLAVYEQLSQTQGEIEQVKGRMTYLQKLSAMATITVNLSPEESEPPVIEEGWRPARTLRNAARTLVGTLEVLGDAIIWFAIYVLPILLVMALPVVVLVWVLKRRRRGRRSSG